MAPQLHACFDRGFALDPAGRYQSAEELAAALREAGFGDVRFRLFAGGIVALHTGVAE